MNITQVPSPNQTAGRQGNKVSLVVIHWIVGTLASADAVFKTPGKTSAHYGIENGVVHQYVSEANTAYHAGDWNTNLKSIGIEHSAAPGRPASDTTYATSIQLIAEICKRYGLNPDTAIVPHNSIVATQCPGTMDLNRIKQGVKLTLLGGDMQEPVNKGDVTNVYQKILGRDPDAAAFGYVGWKWKDFIYAIINSKEYEARINDLNMWISKAQVLQSERDGVLYPQIEKQNEQIKDLTKKLEIAQAANGDGNKWQTLKALLKELIS